MKYIILVLSMIALAKVNYAQELPLSIEPLYHVDAKKIYTRFIYPLEWETHDVEYLFPSDSASFIEVSKHYYFQEREIITELADTIVEKIIPGKYEYWLDTVEVSLADTSRYEIQTDTSEALNVIFYYLVIRPALKILIQHQHTDFCCDYLKIGTFTTWSLHEEPPLKILYKSYSLTDQTTTIHLENTQAHIFENLKVVQPPKAIYKAIPEKRKRVMTVVPKSDDSPKHLIRTVKIPIKKIEKEAKQLNRGGWYEYKLSCSCTEMPFMNFGDLSILRLQYALNQMGYQVKQTNIIDYDLLGILARMDLETLGNEGLMRTASMILDL